MGKNALEVVRQNQGSIDRTVEMIVKNLGNDEIFVSPDREARGQA
jgi:hypothetical protein